MTGPGPEPCTKAQEQISGSGVALQELQGLLELQRLSKVLQRDLHQTEDSLQNGGDLRAWRRAQQCGERDSDQGQDGLQFLHNVGEELVGQDTQYGGNQNNLERAHS